MDTLLDRIRQWRWWVILKALLFDGGPSSTRWVYICGFAVVSVCLLSLNLGLVVVYVHSKDHHVDTVFAGLVGAVTTAFIGFITDAQNKRNALNAAAAAGDGTIHAVAD